MNREKPAPNSRADVRVDKQGKPLIEHRPMMHCHVPGGGAWIEKAMVMMDFPTHLTGQPFAKHYDSYSAISGGAIAVAAILLPKHSNSGEPLHHDFRTVRPNFETDLPKIFPQTEHAVFDFLPLKKYRRSPENFFIHRLWSEIKHGAANMGSEVVTNLRNTFTRAVTKIPDIFDPLQISQEGKNPLASRAKRTFNAAVRATYRTFTGMPDGVAYIAADNWRMHQIEQAKKYSGKAEDWLNAQAQKKREKVHFDGKALWGALRDNLRVERVPGETYGSKINARMVDVVAPLIIPAIEISGTGNSYKRFVRPPISGQTAELRPKLAAKFEEQQSLAAAVYFSSLLPTAFTTTQDKRTGTRYSDGGSNYSPFRGLQDMLALYSPDQKFAMCVYECNMSNRPPAVTSDDLDNSNLIKTVANTMSLNVRAARAAHDDDIEGDPRCRGRVEFKRPVLFDNTSLPPTVAASMDRFSREYVGMSLDAVAATHVPEVLDTSSQTDSRPETMRMFKAAGVQAILRNLPEMVAHTKHLVLRGPLSDTLAPKEQAAILQNIDVNFPPEELQEMKAGRKWVAGANPEFNAPYIHESEQEMFDHLAKRRGSKSKQAAPVTAAQPVQDYSMAK